MKLRGPRRWSLLPRPLLRRGQPGVGDGDARQVRDLALDSDGIARRGLLVRHLVLPSDLAGTREVTGFLRRAVSAETAVNLMDQYHPCYRADDYPPLDRPLSLAGYDRALAEARDAGLHRSGGARRR
ncbi:MAG: hypothetical protein PVG09_07875 [Thiohalocapsa sp.]